MNRLLLIIGSLLVFTQCESPKVNLPFSNLADSKDSIVYYDDPGYSTLVRLKDDTSKMIKSTFWEGFPITRDTLIRDNTGEWWSRKYTTHYQVTDSCVNWWFDLKVVHPSSNWQGQTPGLQRLPFTGKRLSSSNRASD